VNKGLWLAFTVTLRDGGEEDVKAPYALLNVDAINTLARAFDWTCIVRLFPQIETLSVQGI